MKILDFYFFPISDASVNITGITNPSSNLKAEFLLDSVMRSIEGTSDSSGSFSLTLPEPLSLDTSVVVTANDNFKNRSKTLTVVYMGTLEFKTVKCY